MCREFRSGVQVFRLYVSRILVLIVRKLTLWLLSYFAILCKIHDMRHQLCHLCVSFNEQSDKIFDCYLELRFGVVSSRIVI